MDDLSQFLQLLYRFGKREVSLYVKAGNLLVTLHSFSLLIVKKKASLKGCLSLFFHMKGVLASRMPPGQHLGEVFWETQTMDQGHAGYSEIMFLG